MASTPLRCAAWIVLLTLACPAGAQEAGELAENLVRLRGEVEQLDGELGLLRQEQRTALAGLAAQRAELQAQLDRQRRTARELAQQRDAALADAREAGVAGDALEPVLEAALARLHEGIARGLPFKREERLGEVEQVRTLLRNGSLPPERAVNRLWALYEDELRLARDNSLHSQSIPLQGERVLAEVVKLGMVALYFRTADGRLGQASQGPHGWHFRRIEAAEDTARVRALFDSLGKQIRQGYFTLPGAPEGAAP